MSRYTGRVTERRNWVPSRPGPRTFVVDVGDHGDIPPINANVEVRVIRSDEEIGKEFREHVTYYQSEGNYRENMRIVADAVENEGEPALADLIRDVAGL